MIDTEPYERACNIALALTKLLAAKGIQTGVHVQGQFSGPDIWCFLHPPFNTREVANLVRGCMGIKHYTKDKATGNLQWTAKVDGIEMIIVIYDACTIVGYDEKTVPAEPETIIPAQPERTIEAKPERVEQVPIWDCTMKETADA